MINNLTNLNCVASNCPCDTCVKSDVCSKKEELKKVYENMKINGQTWYHMSLNCNYYCGMTYPVTYRDMQLDSTGTKDPFNNYTTQSETLTVKNLDKK